MMLTFSSEGVFGTVAQFHHHSDNGGNGYSEQEQGSTPRAAASDQILCRLKNYLILLVGV